MRILIAGVTDFFAPFIVEELVARKHEVAVSTRVEFEWGEGVEALPEASLATLAADWRPEVVIDMQFGPAARARELLALAPVRTIHLSTNEVFGTRPVCPIDEETELAKPESVTAEIAARIEADHAVREAMAQGAPATLIHLPSLYGPRDPRCADWFFLKRVLDGRPHVAVPDGGLAMCHRGFTQTMARGVAQAALSPKAVGQVYCLGEEKLATLAQHARAVARALDYKWEVYSVPGPQWRVPNDRTSFYDLRKVRTQLRYKDLMIPRDGLELTLAWMSQSPPEGWSWPGIETPFDYEKEDALIAECGYRVEG